MADNLKGFTDNKALAILVQCVPPVYQYIILANSTLEDCLQYLKRYCPDEEMYYTATENGRIQHEMLARLPCRVCFETKHSTLLGCKKLREYIPGYILETKRLPEEVYKLCLGTIFPACRHHRMTD